MKWLCGAPAPAPAADAAGGCVVDVVCEHSKWIAHRMRNLSKYFPRDGYGISSVGCTEEHQHRISLK